MIPGLFGALIGAASTAMSFYGQFQQAKSMKQAAKDMEKLAVMKVQAATAEANNVTAQSHENVSRARTDADTYLANVQTNIAGMSGMVNTDSLLESQGKAASVLELQIQDAARAEKMRAQNIMKQAEVDAWELRNKASATRISAFNGLLEGGTKIALSTDWRGIGTGLASAFRSTPSSPSLIDPVSDYSSGKDVLPSLK